MYNPDRFRVAQETLEGKIAAEEAGEHGFGYDPIVFLPGYGKTVAELGESEKNAISHRAKAALAIRRFLA
jgi:XTP/dITP diphosphohydrolase